MARLVKPEIQQAILDEVKADPKHYSITKMARKYRVTKETVSRIVIRGYVKVGVRGGKACTRNTKELELDNDALDIDPVSLKPRNYRRIRQEAMRYRRMLGPVMEDWGESSEIALALEDDHLRRLCELRKHLVRSRLASIEVFDQSRDDG